MANLMKKAIVDKHVKLLDEGKNRHTYCYVTDAVNMMLNIVFQGEDVLYNVGGIETVSITKWRKWLPVIAEQPVNPAPVRGWTMRPIS